MIRGRAIVLGDDIDTNVLAPGPGPDALGLTGAAADDHLTRACLSAVRPDLRAQVRPGDILVAGRNFGQGSQRDRATTALQRMGFAAIVAESMGRIFYRNCIALGLPAIECAGICSLIAEGEEIELDLRRGLVRNPVRQTSLATASITPSIEAILAGGGVIGALRRRLPMPRLNTLSAGQTHPP